MIEVINLNKSFLVDKKRIEVFKNINFMLPDKGLFYLLGKSGSGKSTLLNILEGLSSFNKGKVLIDNIDINILKKNNLFYKDKIGIIFQSFNLIDDLTVKDNLILTKSIKENKREDLDLLINNLGINKLLNKKAYLLSGGEKQRLSLIRTLFNDPKIIFGDEIVAQVDYKNKKMIMETLYKESKNKLVLLATHNLELINDYPGGIITINDMKSVSLTNVSPFINKKSQKEIKKENTKKERINILFPILKKNLIKNFKRNLLSFLIYSFSLLSIFFTISIRSSLLNLNSQLIYRYHSYNLFKVSEIKNISLENSILSINKSVRPEINLITDYLDLNDIRYNIYPNLEYYFSNLKVELNGEYINSVTFSPSLKIDSQLLINNAFYNEYNIDLNKVNLINLTYNNESIFNNKEVKFNYELSLSIDNKVDEFYYMESPKIYYSYSYFYNYFHNLKIDNLNLSYLDIILNSKDSEEFSSYSYLVEINEDSYLDFIKLNNDTLEFSNDETTLKDSFVDLTKIIFLFINIFFFILIISTIFITVFISIYNYLINKKNKAILYILGAKNIDILLTFILENIVIYIFSFIVSNLIYLFSINKLNKLLILLTNIELNLSNVPGIVSIFIFIFFFLVIFLSSLFPINYSFKKLNLVEELKEE